MAFTYSAGTTTPTYAGLVEFNGVRLNDGTFKTQAVPPVTGSPPLRDSVSDLPSDHGGFSGLPLLSPWTFDLDGWLFVTTGADDVAAAIDYLRAAFNLNAGLLTLKVKARGWATNRYLTARVAGGVQILEPDLTLKKVPRRDFVIPMVAPDPRLYNLDNLQTLIVGSGGTTLTNNGTTPAPFTVTFQGPQTNPQIDGPGPAGTNRIKYVGTIASSHLVTVTTNTAAVGGVSAVDDSGANVYGSLAAFTARAINPGSTTWTKSNASGTGATIVAFRDAWAA